MTTNQAALPGISAPVTPLSAPFPYFGGKSSAASAIWARFGSPRHYIEPFAGSLAVLLARPHPPEWETVNDSDGLLVNVWRALRADPDAVAAHADWPTFESDLHARHAWLVGERERLTARLEGDPEWFDARAAGWWLWGISNWIGSGWCSGRGSWHVVDGTLMNTPALGPGIVRQLPNLGNPRAVQTLPVDADGSRSAALRERFAALSARLARVRILAGDWSRLVSSPAAMFPTNAHQSPVAVLLDPPYDAAVRISGVYAHDDGSVAAACRAWALAHGDDPRLRIALCGFADEHDDHLPPGWERLVGWRATTRQGYAVNKARQVAQDAIWFSPHCLRPRVEVAS